jgi:prenyltransferase/squalene oxidase-like repeat protein
MIRRTLALTLVAGLIAVPSAQAANGAVYLASRLKPSGGFAEPGGKASVGLTEWTVMALKAADRDPATMRRSGGHTPTYFLTRRASKWRDAFQLERGILAVVALGRNPRNFARIDLIRKLSAKVARSGKIGKYANSTYWGVLALRAAGVSVPRRSLDFIRARQKSSGGFGYSSSSAADSNDTAAAVMALRAGRIPCNWRVMEKAYDYMQSLQRSDGGYALGGSSGSDSQSTGWVMQARIKCHRSNTRALNYLRDRQRSSGLFEYRAGLVQTPAWVTAQVLPAVRGRAYPIR